MIRMNSEGKASCFIAPKNMLFLLAMGNLEENLKSMGMRVK